MYKQCKNKQTNEFHNCVKNLTDNSFIPFDPVNTDYCNFKKQINENKTELQDADGNVMTAEEAKQFIATLP